MLEVLMKYFRVYDKFPSKKLKSMCLLFVIKFGHLIYKVECFRDFDMLNFILLQIWLCLLSKLCRYMIFKIVKMSVEKIWCDKHDVNGDGNDNFDEKDEIHERFSYVIEKK